MRPDYLQLDVDAYQGPFDLLCTLLLRREMPIEDISLAEIVVGYVQRLAQLEQVDPNTASEFLLLVAGLMEIKARELLAIEAELEMEEPGTVEAQADMLERLIRYTTFKGAAAWLGQRAGQQRWWREASRPVLRRPRGWNGPQLDPRSLQRGMQVLLAQPGVDVRHLVGKHASVHEMTGRLLDMLRSKTSFTLDDVVDGLSRLDQAVTFVAALELCKNGQIELSQSELFGPIKIAQMTARSDGDADAGEAAVGDADDSETRDQEFQTA